MLTIIQQDKKKLLLLIDSILVVAILAFNIIEYFYPDTSVRGGLSSACVFALLVIPSVKLLSAPNSSRFKRLFGVFYLFFLALLLPRGISAVHQTVDIFTNSIIQGLTFLSLVILMIFGLSAYLLLAKESTDRVMSAMAMTDSLTGLANRYSFLEAARLSFERHKEDLEPVALLFLDIDHFKKVNDTYGHLFGDSVLVRFGEVIRGSLRSFDLSCWYGGEEFVVFLSETDALNACKVSRRIMEGVAKISFEQFPEFSFTVSIGVMNDVPRANDTLLGFIEKADKALYVAKKTGRNRIVIYNDSQDTTV